LTFAHSAVSGISGIARQQNVKSAQITVLTAIQMVCVYYAAMDSILILLTCALLALTTALRAKPKVV